MMLLPLTVAETGEPVLLILPARAIKYVASVSPPPQLAVAVNEGFA
jgi:hypothetical protein